ncbi:MULTISPECIES: YuzF family protein [unclassified Bacillus (in: firmicutes)]|uniref:YuzF family protein n=1 Tax=unclassified Bacillus (in: firmicutes) TaxID=185979 RepID=UPI00232D7783|nr:YuzF family protein [Bacillus sp. BP-3]MDC2866478.1 YuzF family protein [Bacillus sp. BP-3]
MDYSYEDVYGDFRNGYQLSGEVVSSVDPYVVQTLQMIVGKNVVVDTMRGSLQGMLRAVKPDHIVIEEEDTPFFIRMQQIVWITPEG